MTDNLETHFRDNDMTDNHELTVDEDAAIPKLYNVAILIHQSQVTSAGSTVVFPVTIQNRGLNPDTYALSATSSRGWADTSTVPANVSLAPGATTQFNITVHIPGNATATMEDKLEVYAQGHARDHSRSRTIIACNLSFTDVPIEHPLYEDIMFVACRDILKGHLLADGNFLFLPDEYLSRADFASALMSSYAPPQLDFIREYLPSEPSFPDIPKEHPAYKDIESSTAAGLINAEEDGRFHLEGMVKRGELARALVQVRSYPLITSLPPFFTDVPAEHPQFAPIQTLASRSVVPKEPFDEGAGSSFRPDDYITRAELSTIIRRSLWGIG